MSKITKAASHFAASFLFLASVSPSQADTLKCGTVSIKDGKAVFSVKTVSATRCAKGSELIVNTSELSRQVLASVPADQPLAGTAAGGALTGTYPNPDIAPGTIGPAHLGAFPSSRLSLTNSALLVLNNDGSAGLPNYDVIEVNHVVDSQPPVLGTHALFAPIAGTYLVSGLFSWESSGTGTRTLKLIQYHPENQNTLIPIVVSDQTMVALSSGPTVQTGFGIGHFAAGDQVEMLMYQSSGGSLSSVSDYEGEHAALAIQWISP